MDASITLSGNTFSSVTSQSDDTDKLIINGTKYKLEECGSGSIESVPSVILNGRHYLGVAIPNERKKEYEVIACENKEIGLDEFIRYKREDGLFYFKEKYSNQVGFTESLLCDWSIHSVKRISDGEIFTIGDKCIHKERGIDTLTEFKIEGESLLVYFKLFATYLKYIEKSGKAKLFRTEDGVDYFGEQIKLWYIKPNSWEPIEILGCNYWIAEESKFNISNKWFSSKEAAENWVLMNKPCLSVNDITDIILLTGGTIEKLKQLAKEKINATT